MCVGGGRGVARGLLSCVLLVCVLIFICICMCICICVSVGVGVGACELRGPYGVCIYIRV